MKRFIILAILGLLLGIASPLPVWPGPALLRHLPPGVFSAILIISACIGAIRSGGSKTVGVIGMIYGALATLAGVFFTLVSSYAFMYMGQSEEAHIRAIGGLLPICLGVLVIGITVILLGYKAFKVRRS